jgi:hypothetical protein
MSTVLGGGIVAGWARNTFGMPTFRVHPTVYPEAHLQAPDSSRKPIPLSGTGYPWSPSVGFAGDWP